MGAWGALSRCFLCNAVTFVVCMLVLMTSLPMGCSRPDDEAVETQSDLVSQQAVDEPSVSAVVSSRVAVGDGLLVNASELEQLRELARNDPTDGLRVSGEIEIATADWGVLRRYAWRAGEEFGFGWHVLVTREAALKVIGADRTRVYDTLLRESGLSILAAINGGFFDEDGLPLDMVVSDGVVLSPLRASGGSGIFVLRDGRANIVHRSTPTRGSTQSLQSIDRIIDGGRSLVRRASDLRAARAAVTIGPDGVELVVIAHGESVRSEGSSVDVAFASGFGLTLGEFAEYLIQTSGATKALNLDGGPSVQLRYRTSAGTMLSINGGGPTATAIVVTGSSGD